MTLKIYSTSLVLAAALVFAHLLPAQAERKPLYTFAPSRYAARMNPYQGDSQAAKVGERIYRSQCEKCHEVNPSGLRKGADLHRKEIVQAPPGALFWVIEKGDFRRGMPSFARIPEKYRWQVVAFLQDRKP